MAHFAQLDENNIVIRIEYLSNELMTDENGVEQESLGIQHIHNTIPGSENYTWKQTSYNNNFRGRFAGIGSKYIESMDIFTIHRQYQSWVLNEETLRWEAPIPKPEDTATDEEITEYRWDEDSQSWVGDVRPKPYPSWTLQTEPCLDWVAPVERPIDMYFYEWNEETQNWELT